jgi:hypothetical protein
VDSGGQRYTSLDRIIKRDAHNVGEADSRSFTVAKDPSGAGLNRGVRLLERHTAERLKFLESLGLAEPSARTLGVCARTSKMFCVPCSEALTVRRRWRTES